MLQTTPTGMRMKPIATSLALVAAVLSTYISPAFAQQSVICPGCADSSAAGAIPEPDTHTFLGDLLYTITYSATVQASDGICTEREIEGTSPTVVICDKSGPCLPKGILTANIDDDVSTPWISAGWSVAGSGWVAHDQVDPSGGSGTGDSLVTLYDERARLQCGSSLTTTATYMITMDPGTTPYVVTETADFSISFACGSCSTVIHYEF